MTDGALARRRGTAQSPKRCPRRGQGCTLRIRNVNNLAVPKRSHRDRPNGSSLAERGRPISLAQIDLIGLLESIGQVVAQTGPSDGEAVVRGVVGAGAMNLNPAVITVTMTSATEGSTIVHIRGAAKEGLINQRAGEKAAKRLASLLG